jgi:hypothetical protein
MSPALGIGGSVVGTRIEELFAYTAIDKDGNELVAAFMTPRGELFPLVLTGRERVERMRSAAQMVATQTRLPVRLVRFGSPTELETIEPEAVPAKLVVHVLNEGHALCGGVPGAPYTWPANHKWVSWAEHIDKGGATCPRCVAILEANL